MFTYPKSTVHVLCMLMRLNSGYVTATGEFPPLNFFLIRIRALGGLTLGFAPDF